MQQTSGRVPSRRLSRFEYEHTLHDLLGIGGQIAKLLPPESKSGSFDVVAAKQDMSNVHVKGFLKAADALRSTKRFNSGPSRTWCVNSTT